MTRRRSEYFRIQKFRRIYDRSKNSFRINVSYQTATSLSKRCVEVAEGFGLGVDEERNFVLFDDVEFRVAPGDVVYVTGDSGSGKSVLLKVIREDLQGECLDVSDIRIYPDKPLVETLGESTEEALELLSKAGLGDAFLFLRKYGELSDGQKYRYLLARLMESSARWWVCDEFLATLDRDTAKVVAWNFQKAARALGRTVVVATTHQDLRDDLRPDVVIHKRFGSEIQVTYSTNTTYSTNVCSLVNEMKVEPGDLEDWHKLSAFHYRGHHARSVRKVFKLVRGSELCGVIVYSYPPIGCAGRNLVLPKMSIQELNKKLSIVSRVVVHPKYRSIGLGAWLIRETLPLVGTDVEMVAVMAKYNPFAERAGMKRVLVQQPSREASRISEVLQGLRFDVRLLGSEKYVQRMLKGLSDFERGKLREVLRANGVPRLQKELISGRSGRFFASKKEWEAAVSAAGLEDLARVIRVCGLLLQEKVYLFWSEKS